MSEPAERLRRIPSIDRLIAAPWAVDLLREHSRAFVVERVRSACDDLRAAIRRGVAIADPIEREIERRVTEDVSRRSRAVPRPVVNATGVGLHTNLGRALLPEAAVEAITAAARSAIALEYDLESGRRGERDHLVEEDLLALTGAEAATVVNNNAAAVLLALSAIAEGREVVVSRGELIEIGGSFRIPEVMAKSGARLREVGTTNRTHVEDYARAIGAETGALLKVHTSNYRIVGFTAEVGLAELVALGRERAVPVIEDLGSGALVDLSAFGLPKEPVVAERIALGADVVTFSGDKLLGGPQAGILVGRRDAIERIRRNPLRRALRPGKLTLAALGAVLSLYRRSPELAIALPTLRWLTRPPDELERIGRAAAERLGETLGAGYRIAVEDSIAEIGSGAMPTAALPSKVVAISHPEISPDEIARRFRRADPPVIGRIEADRFLLDLRGVFDPASLVPRHSP
ncbi:MAG: L-seryl-tRNA(Ser) seleniumtransferase [Candidatus Binatota bacterium]|nr:L-seryl-tRNA(Ser) seleniumtransferase [Candidatus Binatota bacterium]